MIAANAKTIEAALAKRYAAPEYAFLLQVRNGTGFQRTVRTADALAFSLYPSRGLTIAGFEIKVSKGDWKRELENPDKAEDIARFCHRWFIVAPKGVVPVDEVPDNWGLQELYDSGRLITTKPCLPNDEPEPLTPLMIASVMRNASGGMIPRAAIQSEVDAAVEDERKRAQHELKHRDRDHERLKDAVKRFEEASGVHIAHWHAGEIGEAVKTVMRYQTDPEAYLGRLQHIRSALRELDNGVDAAIAQLGKIDARSEVAS